METQDNQRIENFRDAENQKIGMTPSLSQKRNEEKNRSIQTTKNVIHITNKEV